VEVHAEVDGSGVPLAVLLKRELHSQKVEKPDILFREASKSMKGEDFMLLVPKCHRSPAEGGSVGGENASDDDAISVFAVMIHWLCSCFCLGLNNSTLRKFWSLVQLLHIIAAVMPVRLLGGLAESLADVSLVHLLLPSMLLRPVFGGCFMCHNSQLRMC
jgi:hypothetical protein